MKDLESQVVSSRENVSAIPSVESPTGPDVTTQSLRPWSCRAAITPRTWLDANGTDAWVESNGSEGCLGGWEIHYAVEPAVAEEFLFELAGDVSGASRQTDELIVEAFWYDRNGNEVNWDPVLLDQVEGMTVASSTTFRATFRKRLSRPPNAVRVSIRFGLRWSATGKIRWHGWRLRPVGPRQPRTLRVGVASGRPPAWTGPAGNLAHYLDQCRNAGDAGVQLVCLPETILTWGSPDRGPEDLVRQAVTIPGSWLEPFQQVARDSRMGICFSVFEQAGQADELVYNTAVLLGRDGSLLGTYRKVHLAIGEIRSGVTAGHGFPVFDFDGIRIGPLICMDTTASESIRIVAQRGAEIVLMPIMGDFRATPWLQHDSTFCHQRWQLAMGAHAFDNHVYFVAARNESEGSIIVAPWGEPLAYNDGDGDVIWADVNLDDRRSHWRGSTIQTILWSMRRPAVYGSLADASQPVGPASERLR